MAAGAFSLFNFVSRFALRDSRLERERTSIVNALVRQSKYRPPRLLCARGSHGIARSLVRALYSVVRLLFAHACVGAFCICAHIHTRVSLTT